MSYDLVVRGGLIVDGSGGEPFRGDIAINGDRIVAVGNVTGAARREIDARGHLVTPGWVDIHTHYDGQITWESRITPSSTLGATTVVVGNCGVGFAPVRAGDHDTLIRLMEGSRIFPARRCTRGCRGNGRASATIWMPSTCCRMTSMSRCRCRMARCASM